MSTNQINRDQIDESYSAKYTFEMALSICVSVFLWNLTVLVRIRFGNQDITHLSVWPYAVSLILVTMMIFEFFGLTFIANYFVDEWRDLLFDLWDRNTIANQFMTPLQCFKGMLLQIILFLRVHEREALVAFCAF